MYFDIIMSNALNIAIKEEETEYCIRIRQIGNIWMNAK